MRSSAAAARHAVRTPRRGASAPRCWRRCLRSRSPRVLPSRPCHVPARLPTPHTPRSWMVVAAIATTIIQDRGKWGAGRSAQLDGDVDEAAVLRPRAVVVAYALVAEQLGEDEPGVRRALADA